MATPTYWADKLVSKIISMRSSRREFLKATTAAGLSLSMLGTIDVLSGYAGAQATENKKTVLQEELYNIMWKRKDLIPSDCVARLIEILDKAISDKDPVIIQAAAEGLMLFADDRVFRKLVDAYEKFPDDKQLQCFIIQLMTIHFILNPQARRDLDFFFKNRIIDDDGVAKAREKKERSEIREMWKGVFYWGNFSFRSLRKRLRKVRLTDNHGGELVLENKLGDLIKQIFPPFNVFARYPTKEGLTLEADFMKRSFGGWVDYTKPIKKSKFTKKAPEQVLSDEEAFGNPKVKITDWKKQIADESLPINDRLLALFNWDEVENLPQDPANSDLLIKMLDAEPPEIKRGVVAIFGSSWEPNFPTAVETRLVEYLLESADYELVLAAAKALRFRDGLPVDDILKMLEQKKDNITRQQLTDILLSSLASPKTFWHLVSSFIMTDPKNEEDRKRRADELRIWYLRLGDKGDDVVREAIPSAPRNIQDMVIEWLQDISKIMFPNPPFSHPSFAKARLLFSFIVDPIQMEANTKDILSLVEISKKLLEAENRVMTATITISDF